MGQLKFALQKFLQKNGNAVKLLWKLCKYLVATE